MGTILGIVGLIFGAVLWTILSGVCSNDLSHFDSGPECICAHGVKGYACKFLIWFVYYLELFDDLSPPENFFPTIAFKLWIASLENPNCSKVCQRRVFPC